MYSIGYGGLFIHGEIGKGSVYVIVGNYYRYYSSVSEAKSDIDYENSL